MTWSRFFSSKLSFYATFSKSFTTTTNKNNNMRKISSRLIVVPVIIKGLSSGVAVKSFSLTPIVRHQHPTNYNHLCRKKCGSCQKKHTLKSIVRNQQTEGLSVALQEKTSEPINWDELKLIDTCTSATQARKILERTLVRNTTNTTTRSSSSLYRSITIPSGASVREISDGDLAIQTRLVNKKYKNIMDVIELNGARDIDRASISILCLTLASFVSAATINQNMYNIVPETIRFVFVWMLTFLPIAFVGYGIKDNQSLSSLLVTIQRYLFPSYRQRMIQHEAGHFLLGHLLGWPIAKYQTTNAIQNAVEFYPLSDPDRGQTLAQQLGFDKPTSFNNNNNNNNYYDNEQFLVVDDVPFFSSKGRGALFMNERSVFRNETKNQYEYSKLPSINDPTTTWPYRGFDETTFDQLTVISVAGICSEILAYGNAEGGSADLIQLKQIFLSSSSSSMSQREVDNRIRYALSYTLTQLRRHLGVLDDLVHVMERGGLISECIYAIETCRNPSGEDVFGRNNDYEIRRRDKFRTDNKLLLLIERLFLGNDKNIDTIENRYVEGKGGGYRKDENNKFRLTGDDPLYAAIAVSLIFLSWASTGGLSLH